MVSHSFTVSLLRTSAEGFAGLAATRLAQLDAPSASLGGFEDWRKHHRGHLRDLASALEDSAPERFAAKVAWARDAFVARGMPATTLGAALDGLAAVLEESLPPAAWLPLPEYFDRARVELARSASLPLNEIRESGTSGQLAHSYCSALVAGDERTALALVLSALESGKLSALEVLEGVLMPAQREVGRLWHLSELGIDQEHFATQVTRKLIARVVALAPPVEPIGATVVLTSTSGDAHELGVQVVAAFFELAGWRTIFLGADTPIEDVVHSAQHFQADLVALGATLDEHRSTVAGAIAAVRAARPRQLVLVGGPAFKGKRELWQRIGADGFAATPAEAVRVGTELVGAPGKPR